MFFVSKVVFAISLLSFSAISLAEIQTSLIIKNGQILTMNENKEIIENGVVVIDKG